MSSSRAFIVQRYEQVRRLSEQICAPLAIEDYVVQTMPDASPPKWNLAHTSWFFETFLLQSFQRNYREFHPEFGYLFNSYYEAVGERHPRARRGLLSRPTVAHVLEYRSHVDQAMRVLIESVSEEAWREAEPLIELGLNHEQQHQELMLSDLKNILAENLLKPVYGSIAVAGSEDAPPLCWQPYAGGLVEIGWDGSGFAFDNEGPRHTTYTAPYRLASRLTTNAEYQEFIDDGGYQQAGHWLSAGWALVQEQGWQAPLYWENRDGVWNHFTLAGMQPVSGSDPVCHISYFEADAFASWSGNRLASEIEWELAAADVEVAGNLLSAVEAYGPQRASAHPGIQQLFGDVWEWTSSPYSAYPGYRPAEGAVGEYNGKFMCNQFVLRGGSCATPEGHIRPTYRNFFPPEARWQFSGLRLAQSV
jgi:ergothioneine biosynthesis protein EgtB